MNDALIVVVFFYPSDEQIQNFKKLAYKYNILVVDNTPEMLTEEKAFNYIGLRENKGIAAAQNYGVKFAIDKGFKYLVFFDQDSVIEENYLCNLVGEYERIKKIDNSIAVLGPVCIDRNSEQEYKNKLKSNQTINKVDAVISSGSIVETNLYTIIGGMDESLFIDLVDFEWCWRAKKCGYSTYLSRNLKLYHSIGKEYHRLGPFVIGFSSNQRYYYQYRNTIWLIRRGYVPTIWKFKSFIRRMIDMVILTFLLKNKREFLSAVLRGIRDGFQKQSFTYHIN